MTHFIGSKAPLKLSDDVVSTARYGGEKEEYRYELLRVWDADKPRILWILMNPSVATEHGDDPTIAKCQRYSRAWGFGSMAVGNCFAYRCTDQKRLKEVADPVGAENNDALLKMAKEADLVILGTGSPHHKDLLYRAPEIVELLENYDLHVLELSKYGRPKHPLYLKGDLQPTLWRKKATK